MNFTRKTFGRVATAFVATAMLAALSAVPASAEASGNTVQLKKVIQLAGTTEKVKVPNTTFTFTVNPAEALTTGDGKVINAGIENAVYFAEGEDTITFSPSDTDFSQETVLTVDTSKFTAPGIYRYNVVETEGDYDGMSYDKGTHTLDVYVTNSAAGYKFAYIFDDKAYGDGEGKTDGSIINTYTTHKVTVGKTVEGNQGDKNKYFTFNVTVNGADGEQYTISCGNEEKTLVSGKQTALTLKDGEEFVIYGLSENDTYTITEDSYTSEGYQTFVNGNYETGDTRDDATEGSSIENRKAGTADSSVMFYNYKNASTPTGIVMDVAPYVLLVLAAAAGCFVFLRKRRED